MKKLMFVSMIVMCCVNLAPAADVAGWESFVIRQGGGVSPAINDVVYGGTAAKEFVINAGNMKAAWGTNTVNGYTIGDLAAISIDRLDNYARFTAGSGPYVAPYFNIWVTDGIGNFAVIANEPSNTEWAGTSEWDMTWDILKTKTVKVYENTNKSWLPNSGIGLTFEDLSDYTIMAPSASVLAIGWAGLGTGAPREMGTNVAYGFNWIFGDTLSNYISGDTGFVVTSPIVVPEPATMCLLGLGAVLLRKKK